MIRSTWTSACALGLGLALTLGGCLRSPQESGPDEASNPNTQPQSGFGKARITLPTLDAKALTKMSAGKDTAGDTTALGWFRLSISGEGMSPMQFNYLMSAYSGKTIEVNAIPAGANRRFKAELTTASGEITHQGSAWAAINPGKTTSVKLNLSRITGSAEVCISIEGMPPPPCADSIVTPPDTLPPPPPYDTSLCFYVNSAWISGQMHLFRPSRGIYAGYLVKGDGDTLGFSTWGITGDSLYAILYTDIAPNYEKWIFRGRLEIGGALWNGNIFRTLSQESTSFYGKTLPCPIVPPIDTLPPVDTVPKPVLGTLPLPGNSTRDTVVCLSLHFYQPDGWHSEGTLRAKITPGRFQSGTIHWKQRTYSAMSGKYDAKNIEIFAVAPNASNSWMQDTLSMKGWMASPASAAKGDYTHLPSMEKGQWSFNVMSCDDWKPTSDSTRIVK